MKTKFTALTDPYRLANGVEIPCIGFGTWQLKDGEECYQAVRNALNAGYRHIDTAAVYKNEASVGKAIKDSGIAREELFITTKVWNRDRGYESAKKAFEKSLERLGLDYVDLYLIHWPAVPNQFENWKQLNADTWRAMEELYREGKIRAIGVSNFLSHLIEALKETAEILPMVNQIEVHPGYMQAEDVKYCQSQGILVEGWSPLGQGGILSHELLQKIAGKYGKTAAQICIRWALEKDVLPLPRTTKEARAKENADVFDFSLSQEDIAMIDALPVTGWSGMHPDEVDF